MTDPTTRPSGEEHGRSAGDEPLTGAKMQVRAMLDDARTAAREKGAELRSDAESAAEERKTNAAESMTAVATALHAAGDSLREQHQERLARLGSELAGEVERMASYLRRNDIRGLLDDLEGFGRRHPAAFLGTTLVGGVLAGRFLRSTRRGDGRDHPTSTASSDRGTRDDRADALRAAPADPAAAPRQYPLHSEGGMPGGAP